MGRASLPPASAGTGAQVGIGGGAWERAWGRWHGGQKQECRGGHMSRLCKGPVCGVGVLGVEEGGVVPAVLARGRWFAPEALAAGTKGPQGPLGVVLCAGVRVHPTLLVHHPLRLCPGPVVGAFAPGTKRMGRAEEYLGCGVVWCADGAVAKRQRPRCLSYGNSKTGTGVCMCVHYVLCVLRTCTAAGFAPISGGLSSRTPCDPLPLRLLA